MKDTFPIIVGWIFATLVVGMLLLFTRIGGYVNYIVSSVLGIGILYLTYKILSELFDFYDWKHLRYWKIFALRVVGVIFIGAIIALIQQILPAPSIGSRNCESFAGRYGMQTTCFD